MMYNNSYSGNPYVEVGVLTDPDGLQEMRPAEVLAFLFR